MRSRVGGAVMAALAGLLLGGLGCAGKKDTAASHFGVEVHHPKFHGVKDFFAQYQEVVEITVKHRLGGEPVDVSWIAPAFRERLCLTLTINNHCVA